MVPMEGRLSECMRGLGSGKRLKWSGRDDLSDLHICIIPLHEVHATSLDIPLPKWAKGAQAFYLLLRLREKGFWSWYLSPCSLDLQKCGYAFLTPIEELLMRHR
jgi:hypothetical protein